MYGFKILIRGDYALFSRPEMKVERVSYDVPTPSALVGLISAVYWHPGVRYVIDKIVVYRPVDFVNIRRNELSEKLSLQFVKGRMQGRGEGSIYSTDQRTQRAALLLKDVEYGVEFHFVLTEEAEPDMTEEKCYNILLRPNFPPTSRLQKHCRRANFGARPISDICCTISSIRRTRRVVPPTAQNRGFIARKCVTA